MIPRLNAENAARMPNANVPSALGWRDARPTDTELATVRVVHGLSVQFLQIDLSQQLTQPCLVRVDIAGLGGASTRLVAERLAASPSAVHSPVRRLARRQVASRRGAQVARALEVVGARHADA